ADLAMALDLQGCNTFLGSSCSPECIAPVPKLNPGFFVNRTDANRILLLAVTAEPQKAFVSSSRLSVFHGVHIRAAAKNTARAISPSLLFKKLNCCCFVGTRQRNLLNEARP